MWCCQYGCLCANSSWQGQPYMQKTFTAPSTKDTSSDFVTLQMLHLLTNTEVFSTLATMLYKIYRTFSMNLEYIQPIITMDVLTETLTLKLKLTLISSLYDAKFWKELQFLALMSFIWHVWFWNIKCLKVTHKSIIQLEEKTNAKNNRMNALSNSVYWAYIRQ